MNLYKTNERNSPKSYNNKKRYNKNKKSKGDRGEKKRERESQANNLSPDLLDTTLYKA